MIRTAIFGGSFDPIHTGHAMVANYVAQSGIVDEVWLMPGRINPLKAGTAPASDAHRLAMCRLVAEDCAETNVCDAEMSLPAPSYTVNTMRHLVAQYPDRRFSLLIGSDNWLCFDQWHEHDWLLSNFEIIVYPRPGYNIDPQSMPAGVTILQAAPMALISSTFVRDGFAAGRNMNFFIPAKVLNYINKHQIYG